MLAHEGAERFPVSDAVTMACLVVLLGAVVAGLLIASMPVRKRIAIDVEQLTDGHIRATSFDSFDGFLSEVLGCRAQASGND